MHAWSVAGESSAYSVTGRQIIERWCCSKYSCSRTTHLVAQHVRRAVPLFTRVPPPALFAPSTCRLTGLHKVLWQGPPAAPGVNADPAGVDALDPMQAHQHHLAQQRLNERHLYSALCMISACGVAAGVTHLVLAFNAFSSSVDAELMLPVSRLPNLKVGGWRGTEGCCWLVHDVCL